MKKLVLLAACLAAAAGTGFELHAQQPSAFDRLPVETLDVTPPSERVNGAPGAMRVSQSTCAPRPAEVIRRRIVDVAVQEWAFFGFSISDQTGPRLPRARRSSPPGSRRRGRGLGEAESARLADSIGGYWAVTPEGGWILERQNDVWNGPRGIDTRWRDPWSAAFISWVMCEAGIADRSRFQRAIAHHTYIDQAIRSRDGANQAAFVAYDIGETTIEPGDLLCSARRPGYSSLSERRRQMGEGARTHCDVVVKLDPDGQRILAIGGNVRSRVSMKLLPAVIEQGRLRPDTDVFAHLKLRADTIEAEALDNTPTIRALGCAVDFTPPAQLTSANVTPRTGTSTLC